MKLNRREALSCIAATAAGAWVLPQECAADDNRSGATIEDLDRVLARPVVRTELVKDPVIVESIELLRQGNTFVLRTRSSDGAEAITLPNPGKMGVAAGVLLRNVVPVFVGQDARNIESLLWDVYRHSSNYKMQGLLFWVAVAAVEMGILELLSQSARCPLADLFGGTLRRDIAVYYASGNRGNTPQQEVEHLHKLVGNSGVRAVKWRLGGRMSRNADSRPQRTEQLIPLVRESFGDDFTIYGDANSSYNDAQQAIRLGRMMEEYNYGFFEEPCEFDNLWSTKAAADALSIPVAGGEQEFSMHRWKWMIANRAVDIVQPDLHYGGGFIRATQVARMAAAAGLTVVPHMSGGGLGYVEVIQFASFTPNIGPFMEFKGNTSLPLEATDSTLRCEQGQVRCPSGIGFGVQVDQDWISQARPYPN